MFAAQVDHLRARATVTGADTVTATLPDGTEKKVMGSYILVATGSSPTRPRYSSNTLETIVHIF